MFLKILGQRYLIFILAMVTTSNIYAQMKHNAIQDFSEPRLFTNDFEWPAADHKGNMYAVNFARQGTISLINSKGLVAILLTYLEAVLAISSVWANRALCMWKIILRIVPHPINIDIYAQNTQMYQPNKNTITVNNTIYANDPNWHNNFGQLWMVKPHADLILLEAEMGTTNDIEVCADEKRPYVKESFQRKIWLYDILPNSKVANKKLFYPFQEHGLDGMRCDHAGNLYAARYGA